MSEHMLFTAYKIQSEVVHREKEKLRALNAQLLAVQRACTHDFIEGACGKCGVNEELYNRIKELPTSQNDSFPCYQFVD